MPKKLDFKQLDLSKEPDQNKFDEEFGELPKDEQEKVADETREGNINNSKQIEAAQRKIDDENKIQNLLLNLREAL